MAEDRAPGTSAATRRRAARALTDLLGYERPRPGQVEAIAAVLEGRDTLAVLPTGSGKSAVYQVAAALNDGPTVVVSPLISLQHDQVRALEDADVGESSAANSSLSDGRRDAALAAVVEGDIEFLFLAPEQLARPEAVEQLVEAAPSLFVVDEAHCVSSWGHDFRPDYLGLRTVVEALGHPTVLGLTATAAPPVRDDIVAALGLDDPTVVVGNFDRPEIHLEVVTFHDADDKRAAVVERAAGTTGPGLVYVATRAHAEEVAEALAAAGRQAEAYHAGLGDKVRRSTQDRFLSGDLDVVVATNAFGMGIDKPDIRFVLHHDVPGSVDAYYQEIGRAGRDGEPAEAVLFWRSEDLDLQRYFAGGSVDTGALGQVAQAVHDAGGDTTRDDLAEATGLGDRALSRALNLLAGGGALDLDGAGQVSAGGADAAAVIAEVARQDEERHEVERSRVAMVRAYAEGRSCRRGFVLNYFGQDFDPPCGNCDVCCSDRGAAPEAGELADELPVGCVVGHREWGKGRVVRHDEDTVTVLFDDAGYKVLSAPLVRERGLLVPDVAVR